MRACRLARRCSASATVASAQSRTPCRSASRGTEKVMKLSLRRSTLWPWAVSFLVPVRRDTVLSVRKYYCPGPEQRACQLSVTLKCQAFYRYCPDRTRQILPGGQQLPV